MKSITLNLPLKNMDDQPILKENKERFLYGDALMRILGEVGVARQESGENKLRAYQLGIKIREGKEKISFDNHDDYDFIYKQVKESQSFGAVVIGPLMEYFDKVNKNYEEGKKQNKDKKNG